ncbi:hypothetical protein NQ314_005560 [Rhamnusium bicolor]|uniref:Uncharacterized protein n=1 Tax=Rhamnusium bicolor TaxID=1586634 RepID=A0AAV8ZIG1_9CUCU|nr:hypothetical protein NQ314_005560 [Rhamnusium bicolor]
MSFKLKFFMPTEEFSDENANLAEDLVNTMTVVDEFLREDEERSILDEIDPYMKKLRYEFDHWDDVSYYTYSLYDGLCY